MRKLEIVLTIVEDVLVDVCLHGVIKDYRVCLENLSFSSFLLVDRSHKMNE